MDNQFATSWLKRSKTRMFLSLGATTLACAALVAAARPGLDLSSRIPEVSSAQEVGKAFTEVTKRAAPAVVFIQVEKQSQQINPTSRWQNAPEGFGEDFFKKFFGDRWPNFEMPEFEMPKQPWRAQGQGSGFIISKDGYILTNAHVVHGADRVNVVLADGRDFEASIIGADRSSDVAVIKIDARDLPTLKMGNSDDLEVGEWVLAVGSPFGLSGTVTSGIVSATGRSSVGITDYEDFIQTDAAINPGNSGGPLVNLHGEAIGINTAILSRTGAYNGIGLAIPINMAREICDQIMEDGSVTRGYLGIMIQQLTADLAKSFDVEDSDGVLVGDVTRDSPADKAGFEPGDVIVEFAGHPVKNPGALRNRVASSAPGSDVDAVVIRDGKRIELPVIVGTLAVADQVQDGGSNSVKSLGLSVRPLNDELRGRYGYEQADGLVIVDVQSGSRASQAGLKSGMLIKQINRKPVVDLNQFRAALEEGSEDETLLLMVQDGDHTRFVSLKLHD